jgi:hypothetical protein
MPVKMDHHHRVTVAKLFTHPLSHNVQWHDVISLLERFGEVHESHRGNWSVTVEGETTSFGAAGARDLSDDQVIGVRRFLRRHGITGPVTKAA